MDAAVAGVIVVATGVTSWLLWRFLPVGTVHGRTIRLCEWHRWRLNLKIARIDRLLAAVLSRPADERFVPLCKLALKYCAEPLGRGSRILEEIGALGSDESLPLVREFLKDGPSFTTEPLLRGIWGASQRLGPSSEWRTGLYNEISRHAQDPSWTSLTDYYDTLFALDGIGAAQMLNTARNFQAEETNMLAILCAFEYAGYPVEENILRQVLERRKPSADRLTVQVLKALALHDPATAKRDLWQILRSGTGLALLAAEALRDIGNLCHPRFGLDDRVRASGLHAVSPEERVVWLVDHSYIYPISCGGLERVFEELSPERIEETAAALRTIGAERHAERLVAAAQRIADPAHGQAGSEPGAQDLAESREDVELLNMIYLLNNPTKFVIPES